MWRIPITADTTEFTQSVELDGSTYVLKFSYSERTTTWYLDLFYLQEGTALVPVLTGSALVVNSVLLAGVTHEHRPAGELMVRGAFDPNYAQLGALADLVYFDAEELGV